MKYGLPILLIFIFHLGFSHALDFGISPEEIILSGNVGEKVCKEFSLIGQDLIFNGKVKWSYEKTKNIKDYVLSGKEFEINVDFPNITNSGKKEICIEGKNPGKYNGALFYKIEETNYGIGTWINLKLEDSNPKISEIFSKRKTIEISKIEESQIKTLFISQIMLFISLILLIIIIKINYFNPSRSS
ncbi:MAG: hypothetical protein WDZ62_01140 [Candidatus Pacearchaeota archaeon]